jgi:hypothetical protein
MFLDVAGVKVLQGRQQEAFSSAWVLPLMCGINARCLLTANNAQRDLQFVAITNPGRVEQRIECDY